MSRKSKDKTSKATIQDLLDNISIEEFIRKLTIVNKKGKKQQLNLNSEQEEILTSLLSGEDTLILKPRQIGSTTICAAFLFAEIYFSTTPITFAVLSYKLESAKQILKMIKHFYHSLPASLQRPTDVNHTTELSFKDGGRIIAVAATQTGGLRSFTATKIQLSEYAFADNPEELKATALGALNDGQLIIESTANFFGDCLHQEIQKWDTGTTSWNYLFFPWTNHQEYAIKLRKNKVFSPTERESELMDYGLSIEQILWRRKKISLLGYDKFLREYPLSLEEAYAVMGDTYFNKNDFEYTDILPASKEGYEVFFNPDKQDSYAIGVDVGGGVGKDYSAIFVMSKKINSPVALWRDNTTSPIDLAHIIQELHEKYNNALVLVEANNYGWAVLNELSHIGVGRVFKDENNKDFLTTSKTKPLVFEDLKKKIQHGYIKMLDDKTVTELRTILVDNKGRIKFADTSTAGHSDSAMALALANWCLNYVRLKQEGYLPQWIKDKKTQRIKDSTGAIISNHRRY